jgi:hypothetical protein
MPLNGEAQLAASRNGSEHMPDLDNGRANDSFDAHSQQEKFLSAGVTLFVFPVSIVKQKQSYSFFAYINAILILF